MADETMPIDDHKWGWQAVGHDYATGPFDSRDAASASARADTSPGKTVRIGRVAYPEPAEYCSVDLDNLLEHAEELATDDAWWSDEDAIFDVNGDRERAQKSLNAAMATWAAKWIRARVWTLRDTVPVVT